jgi:alpha-glucosidase
MWLAALTCGSVLSPARGQAPAELKLVRANAGPRIEGSIDGQRVLQLALEAIDAGGAAAPRERWADQLVAVQNTPEALGVSLPDQLGLRLRARGTAWGLDLFPCTPHEAVVPTPILRATSGPSRSTLNTGVYCRDGDWALEFAPPDLLELTPAAGVDSGQACTVDATGRSLRLHLTPHLYRDERQLAFFRPREYSLPNRVPSGWISWKAYKGAVTQQNIRQVADWAAANLRDYGLEYLIIDDGWFVGSNRTMLHSVPGDVDWTRGNQDFSDGLAALADYVHDRGLKIGLWFTPFGCSTEQLFAEHPDWWVHQAAGGEILKSGWHGVAFVDGTCDAAIAAWLTRGIRAQAEAGVDYFKIDGQKHVAYDAYSNSGDWFTARGIAWQDALRRGWAALRRAAGDRYVLACWGRVPEIAGYPLAIRIGEDKDSSWAHIVKTASDLAQWFYEHNIVWCDDPDHMVFAKLNAAECRTWATLLGLTGTHLTFSDKTEVYSPDKLDILRRILPVVSGPVTRPAALYRQEKPPALWTLEIDRPFDHWLVVANSTVGAPVEALDFAALGLAPDKDYAVFDFWNDEFRGVHRGQFACGRPRAHDTQVFAIREVRPHPWVASTNRHITQGAVDLRDVRWIDDAQALAGQSHVVAGDPYALTIHIPKGFALTEASFGDEAAAVQTLDGAARVRFTPKNTGVTAWQVKFQAEPSGESRVAADSETAADANAADSSISIDGPGNRVKCIVATDGGQLTIAATLGGVVVLEPSPIRVTVDGKSLTAACDLGDVVGGGITEKYPWRGPHAIATNDCRTASIAVAPRGGGVPFRLEVRVFPDGVAYRYVIPAPADDAAASRVPDETTALALPAGSTVWFHDLRGHYEAVHQKFAIADVPPGSWAAPPLTYRLPAVGGYASITEANLVNFSGMALRAVGDRKFELVLGHAQPASYPFELRYQEDVERMKQPAAIVGEITSPWRVLLIAADLSALVNADVVHNLNPPPDPAIFPRGMNEPWIKPGRAVWKYLDGGDNSLDGVLAFNRMAGELGFEYQVVEGFWRRWSDAEVRRVVADAKARGVGLWFWRGSRELRTPEAREQFFSQLEQWGVVGAKIDFFDHEHKDVIDLYAALLESAARHHVMVNFHGANKPTGLERTWPNMLTLEGVKGMEARSLPNRAQHDATLPFTRYLAGPGDYTPVVFGERRADTTAAHQIATAAVFDEPLLTFGAYPQKLLDHPAVEIIKAIPAVWDETLVLPPSEIGEVAAYARRNGDDWWLAVVNGPAARKLAIPATFLGAATYNVLSVRDAGGDPTQVQVENATAKRGDKMEIALDAGGGYVARFTPAK